MTSPQRTLVALDMLSDDINLLNDSQVNSELHFKLLSDFLVQLNQLNVSVQQESEAAMKRLFVGSLFEQAIGRKSMITVYMKLLNYVLTAWDATLKADAIINDNFDDNADVRLELLQVKAIKAKSQLKTVASAMGKQDYEVFCSLLGLTADKWQWDTLRARF
ncbi:MULTISPECIES: hypothetical protein [unclassified Alteromonas]|uniref:hypothetical protein n=1 Tax=unclassified Alteromonas TaxID=2614992 RepID=UPI000509B62B|nr:MULTISPECIES: hypothetical protein [unclassified Alteromonas]